MQKAKVTIFSKISRILLFMFIFTGIILLNFLPKFLIHQFNTYGYAHNIHVEDDKVAIADGYGGLPIINISLYSNPNLIDYVYIDERSANDVYIDNGKIFIAYGYLGLLINDFNSPSPENSTIINPVTGNYVKLHISEGILYVITERYEIDIMGGFHMYKRVAILNVTDPLNPRYLTTTHLYGSAWDIFAVNNTLYLVDLIEGLVTFDVSDPSNPISQGYVELNGFSRSVYVSEGYAYIAEGSNGLTIIDVSDPSNPGEPSTIDVLGTCLDVWVEDDFAYIAASEKGMAIVDISNPLNPGRPVYVDTIGSAQNIHVKNGVAYIADGSNGLVFVNLSNVLNEIEYYNNSLFKVSLMMLIVSPIGMIFEFYFLIKWILKKREKSEGKHDKTDKIKPMILVETSVGMLRTILIGSYIGLIFVTTNFISEALSKTSKNEIMIILFDKVLVFVLISTLIGLFGFPMFKGLYYEISIGFVLGGLIGATFGATFNIGFLIKYLLLGMISGISISLITLVSTKHIRINLKIKKEIKLELKSVDSKLNSIRAAAEDSYDKNQFENFIRLKFLILDTLIDAIYFKDYRTRSAFPRNYRDLIDKIKNKHNFSVINQEELKKWVITYGKIEKKQIVPDLELMGDFKKFFDSIFLELNSIFNHIKTQGKIY